MKNFILIGSSGYVAKKHLNAIKKTKNNLLAAYDIKKEDDLLNSFFPKSNFFSNLNSLQKFITTSKTKIHYLVICSPNHLHYKHIKFGYDNNLNIICEKPIVINNYQYNKLKEIDKKKNIKIHSILQLRTIPSLKKLKDKIEKSKKIHQVNLIYYTERNENYFQTWKGNNKKSGGTILNIGVHFFDLLIWLFGSLKNKKLEFINDYEAIGKLSLKKAEVNWKLVVKKIKTKNKKLKVYRSIKIGEKEITFSKTFDDLHVLNYRDILKSKKSNYVEAYKAINLVNSLKKKNYAI